MTKRSTLSEIRRSSYLLSRTIGDVQAAQRGTIAKRLVRRSLMRAIFRMLR